MMNYQTKPASRVNDRSDSQKFSSFLAHEVRGPLTVILGNAHVLEHLESYNDVARQSVEEIRDEAEKLRRIIEGLLALFGERLESEPLSTGTVMSRIVELFHKQHPARPVVLAVNTESFAVGVQSYVEEIVENLLSNADKYSPPGGSIDIEIQDSGPNVTISVSDRGQGICPSEAERIFGLFVRLDHPIAIPGHGIGLALSRQLAEAMDGELTYEARPEGGSRFTLTLPAEQALFLTAV